jgi:hypothetical protein
MKLLPEVNLFSSGSDICRYCNIDSRFPSFKGLLSAYFSLAACKLSGTQKEVLRGCVNTLHRCEHDMTLTALADQVSTKTGIPYSTVKWNMRVLVDLELLEGGDAENRGCPAQFTEVARLLVRELESTESL